MPIKFSFSSSFQSNFPIDTAQLEKWPGLFKDFIGCQKAKDEVSQTECAVWCCQRETLLRRENVIYHLAKLIPRLDNVHLVQMKQNNFFDIKTLKAILRPFYENKRATSIPKGMTFTIRLCSSIIRLHITDEWIWIENMGRTIVLRNIGATLWCIYKDKFLMKWIKKFIRCFLHRNYFNCLFFNKGSSHLPLNRLLLTVGWVDRKLNMSLLCMLFSEQFYRGLCLFLYAFWNFVTLWQRPQNTKAFSFKTK